MVYFLERIARLLFEQYRGEIGNHCLVFPSRRAGLYFLKYYAALIDKPKWAPDILTINEFFSSFSKSIIAENEILLLELFKVYRQLVRTNESFDEFYFWGDMLINDFDDVDKYLVDPQKLFRNVKDYKNIDYQFGDINTEQAEIIKKFWRNFEPEKQSPEKNGFKSIWSVLPELYSRFQESLKQSNLAYEGMIFREVAELFISREKPVIKWESVHFIGFNALNKCERSVMLHLKNEDRARFYWDYDNSYVKQGKLNSAGFFMTENLRIFGNDMPADWKYDTFLSSANENISRKIIETTSDIAQVKIIPEIIRQMPAVSPADQHHTAIILPDESLIVPLLTSLPPDSGDINITMGYPLKMTAVYGLVKNLLELQSNSKIIETNLYFQATNVIDILNHQLVANANYEEGKKIIGEITKRKTARIPAGILNTTELFGLIFRKPEDPVRLSGYIREIFSAIAGVYQEVQSDRTSPLLLDKNLVNEFIYSVVLSLNRLDKLLTSSDISLTTTTFTRILDRMLRNQSVPFSGEPLSGIQIMGFLETRALDFMNIIILSANEGILPASAYASSFIPFSIRTAFDLPVINHMESIYAYHFFRLLHRANNVTFIYNSDTSGLRTGEISRFLLQMKYENMIKPGIKSLSYDIRTAKSIAPEITKDQAHINLLLSWFSSPEGKSVLSPTAINTWLNCRMKFYFRYVCRLKEPEIIKEEIDQAVFGQILHRAMKNIYKDLKKHDISYTLIDSILKNEDKLHNIIDRSRYENNETMSIGPPGGNEIIIKEILYEYIARILNTDKTLVPFAIEELEIPLHFSFRFIVDDVSYSIRIGGNIDRIDRVGDYTRIVDYKTGDTAEKIGGISDLFEDDRKKELDGWLQTLIYCEAYLLSNKFEGRVRPSIYKVKELSSGRFIDRLKIGEGKDYELNNYNEIREDFVQNLNSVICSVFSLREHFRMTDNRYKCTYCPYQGLCQR